MCAIRISSTSSKAQYALLRESGRIRLLTHRYSETGGVLHGTHGNRPVGTLHDRLKKDSAKTQGFSMCVRGNSIIEFPQHFKAEDMCMFLESVRRWNSDLPIVMITDNCRVHHSKKVLAKAESPDIHLVFLPPYSPQYNPIEFIWKSLRIGVQDVLP